MSTDTQQTRIKVLLIEDNPSDTLLLRAMLASQGGSTLELETVDTLTAGLQRLQHGGINLVLLDLSLPDSHGLETFLKLHAQEPAVATIVFSGLDDEEVAMRALHEGAQDYLVKGQVDKRLLVRAIRYATERKRAELALEKERELTRTLEDNIPDHIYFKDRRSRFLRVNRAQAQDFHLNHPDEAIGKTDFDIFSSEHAAQAYADEKRIMETGQPLLGIVEKETFPDGSITWAITSKLPLYDKRHQIIGTFGISRDITELKTIQDKLAVESNLLGSIIDTIPDFIYVKDNQGRYLLDNAAHRRFLGAATLAEVEGRTVFDFFPHELATGFDADDRQVMCSGEPLINREEQATSKKGRVRWNSTSKVPLRDAAGNITGIVGVSRDITAAKEAEEKLKATNVELARSQQQLLETLADLRRSHEELKAAQMQLIQAEKMQSIGRLAAGVAHEVKNPLAILRMGADYLARTMDAADKDKADTAREMKDAVTRADKIICGLLDFAAPTELELRETELRQVIEESWRLVRHELKDLPIRVLRDFQPDLPRIRMDAPKIQQVLINLFLNAIHAMPQGGELVMRTALRTVGPEEAGHDAGSRQADRLRAGEEVVVIEVLDSGSGMSEETLSRMFDPFYTTKPAGKGTGLGLTVTKSIVEMHGGIILIRNRKEGGAIVSILLKK